MDAYNISITTKKADIIPEIMVALSKYDCDIRVNQEKKHNQYLFSYTEMSHERLGEREGRTAVQYKNEMQFYTHAGNVLKSFGISSKHKGYMYAIECIRLINTYGPIDFKMDKDVYPVVGAWYGVSSHSVEHNIRNAIGTAWKRAITSANFEKTSISHFEKKPTNLKFLKHLANITNMSILNAVS